MRTLIAIAALVACSGAWAGQAPEGWKKLDLICHSLERKGYQMDDYFWVSERDKDVWTETMNGGAKQRHESNSIFLSKMWYGPDGEPASSSRIDRSTGRGMHTNIIMEFSVAFDCELRRANKF